MREIKFRAWNGCAMEYGGFSIHAAGAVLCGQLTKVKESSPVMQYSGVKDMDGVEIYEGDILVDQKMGFYWKVLFRHPGMFVASDPTEEGSFVHLDDFDFKAAGNIYENPELLK